MPKHDSLRLPQGRSKRLWEDFINFIRFLCGAAAELLSEHFGRFGGCEAGAAKIRAAAVICYQLSEDGLTFFLISGIGLRLGLSPKTGVGSTRDVLRPDIGNRVNFRVPFPCQKIWLISTILYYDSAATLTICNRRDHALV